MTEKSPFIESKASALEAYSFWNGASKILKLKLLGYSNYDHATFVYGNTDKSINLDRELTTHLCSLVNIVLAENENEKVSF